MQSVSMMRERAVNVIEQMDEKMLRKTLLYMEQMKSERTKITQTESANAFGSYKRLRNFATSIPKGTDIDAIVMEEMRHKHESID